MKSEGAIGAWVKDANSAFANIIRKTSFGDFDRVDWQLLNFLMQRQRNTQDEINGFLAYFENNKEIQCGLIFFKKKALILVENNEVILTEIGIKVFQETFRVQEEVLEKAFHNITKEDYITP